MAKKISRLAIETFHNNFNFGFLDLEIKSHVGNILVLKKLCCFFGHLGFETHFLAWLAPFTCFF
jgi:hypothetical protein